jgi:hypothetical protein
MLGKDIYTNCGMVGLTEWPDGEAGQSGPTEKPDGATRVARNTQWASRADGHPDGCPTEEDKCLTEGARVLHDEREWPDGGCDGCLTEGTRVPDRDREWPDGGHDGCPTEGGVSGGGPTAGLGVAQRGTI